jgi:hypothetical protein
MRSLYLLSQEGMATLAQLILDKILDKCCVLTDRLFLEIKRTIRGGHSEEKEAAAAAALNDESNGLGVEDAVKVKRKQKNGLNDFLFHSFNYSFHNKIGIGRSGESRSRRSEEIYQTTRMGRGPGP